jgi:hypothetical protein
MASAGLTKPLALPGRPADIERTLEPPDTRQRADAGRRAKPRFAPGETKEEAAMQWISARALLGAIALTIITAAAASLSQPAAGQTGEGWVTLLDSNNMGDWNKVGETNWRMEDGAAVADKRTSKDTAHLVTKAKYKDFQIYVEFWASDDANSGIFLRCQDPEKITDRTCYEANIFDQRPDPTYGTGGIVNFAEVNPMPKAGGKWNTFEITAKGRLITVVLNGQKTVELHNGLFQEGYITLQHGAGVIKFRKVAIKSL